MFHYALPSDANLFYFKEADICRLRVRHIANNSPVLVRHIANNMPYRGAANSTNHILFPVYTADRIPGLGSVVLWLSR